MIGKECFLFATEDRRAVLFPYLQAGEMVGVSDTHLTVSHSENVVDRKIGAHRNAVEGLRSLTRNTGGSEKFIKKIQFLFV